ncbi:MAG: 16S rRNA (uracil(1498)-N(3))-methyltransferase [Thiotrichales bacterium]|jgi:16S rRNA (uracil1498-N3)-methyltransferase|nr:16S rRNA (uracil(1498)-N(3))-methyltransferase [Thiotrichales bacterium]
MRTIRLYLSGNYPNAGTSLALPDEARHYLVNVLRARDGFSISLFNGAGTLAQARLQLGKKDASVCIESVVADTSMESPLHLTLAQGISRGERMDTSLQKATELGITAIQPLFTQYCEVKLEDQEKVAKRMAHWQQVIISACEQSGRSCVPTLHAPMSLNDWLATRPSGLVLHPYVTQRLNTLEADLFAQPQSLLIGPEGGLSEAEVTQATAIGMIAVQLGKRILRTETAGPAVIAALQSLFGDA